MSDFEVIYQLHQQNRPFIIANAWNVKTAQLIENSGFPAIAATSGAIAGSLGYEKTAKKCHSRNCSMS